MSNNIRKDNYIKSETTDGVVVGVVLSRKGNDLSIKTSDDSEMLVELGSAVKITKSEYENFVEEMKENDVPAISTHLVPIGIPGVVDVNEKTEKENTSKDPNVPTKADIARRIFAEDYGKKSRKDILIRFQEEANLTKHGSATYYYNFTKKLKEESK